MAMTWHVGGARRPGTVVLIALALLLGACGGDAAGFRNEADVVVSPGVEDVLTLRTGDCLDPAPDLPSEVSELPVVPCDQPHQQEVFGTVLLDEGPYPGAEAVARLADAACLGELESSLGLTLADGLFISYLLPTFIGWSGQDGTPDRRVVCVLVFPDRENATGSVVAGTAELTAVTPVVPVPESEGA